MKNKFLLLSCIAICSICVIPVFAVGFNVPPVPISNQLLKQVLHDRTDLQTAYPEGLNGNYGNLYNWATTEISGEVDRSAAEIQAYRELAQNTTVPTSLPVQKIPIILDSEAVWNLASPTTSPFRCKTFPISNQTILDSLDGSVSYAIISPTSSSTTFTQTLIHIVQSPIYMSSNPNVNNGQCTDSNGVIVGYNNFGNYNLLPLSMVNMKIIGTNSGIYHLTTPEMNLPFTYGYNYITIIEDYSTTSSQGQWDVETQIQLLTHLG